MLLTFSEQQENKPISEKNEFKFSQILKEVENGELIDLIGASFVLALQKESKTYVSETTERMVNVLSPFEYTSPGGNLVRHMGLKYVLSYLVYSRYIGQSHISDTFTGLVHKQRQESQTVSDGTIRRLQQESRDVAVSQFKLIEDFLRLNSAVYPEWSLGVYKKVAKPRIINLRKTIK